MAMWNMKMLPVKRFYGELILVCVFMQCHLIVSSHQEGIVKRMDIATCLGKFDAKNDMIIKTQESRQLGAKFLDSADSISKVECLHLCCETDSCDVFVFEEKGQGACFLFHCGPAQDFRCKFTKHVNYTSAVFSIDKKVPPPLPPPTVLTKKPNSSLLSQNEIDLRSLKRKSSDSTVNVKSNDSPASTVPSTIKSITTPIKNATSHCSRFQFQCHSGECLAIYNACDGIPQCDDGSDEGPECQSITRAPEGASNKLPNDVRIQVSNSNTQVNSNGFIGHNREDPLTAPQWPNLSQTPDLNSIQYADNTKATYNRNGGLHIGDGLQQIPPLQTDLSRQTFATNHKDPYRWNDPNLMQNWPQQMPQFPMKPLQFPQKQPPYTPYQPDLLQKNIGLPDQIKSQQQYTWPVIGPNLPNIIHPDHNNEEVLPEKDAIGVIKDVPVSDRKKDGKNILVQKNESKSTEDSDYNNNEEEEETTTEPPKKKKKHRKVNKIGKQEPEERTDEKDSSAQQLKTINAELQAEFMDHDGAADRPGGAVVSLALGILITIGLVMVVSCRTTAVRKRVRRGKGYAHDADFLVNGMYL